MAAGDYTGWADYLAALLPGLCVQVARAWLAAEGGGPGANNPLNNTCTASGLDESYTGVRCASGSFANYPSVEVGLQASAWMVKHGDYAGIRAAIATHNPQVQRQAIIASPWAGGHYANGAAFPQVSGACQAPSGGSPSGISQASDVTTGGSTVDWTAILSNAAAGNPPASGATFREWFASDPLGRDQSLVYETTSSLGLLDAPVTAGALAKIGAALNAEGAQPPPSGSKTGQGIGLPDLAPLLVNGAVILLIVGLGYKGLTQLLDAA